MYKNYNMTQLTLPIETSVRIPQNDISRYVNEIVETIPDSEFDEFRHHRGATSYHPKMMLKIILLLFSIYTILRIEWLRFPRVPSQPPQPAHCCKLTICQLLCWGPCLRLALLPQESRH
ncbi:transposase for IS1272 [Staphylococcus aureus]|nr:transposase for IS1272 [Staphylococcus aureus]